MDSNTIAPVGQPADLATLAGQINEEHRAATDAAESALEHARRAGELLSEAKAACCHGEWLGWLESNFEGSTRTAQAYMRVASQWTEIQAKAQTSAHLSIDRALKLTAEPIVETEIRFAKDGPFKARRLEKKRAQREAMKRRFTIRRPDDEDEVVDAPAEEPANTPDDSDLSTLADRFDLDATEDKPAKRGTDGRPRVLHPVSSAIGFADIAISQLTRINLGDAGASAALCKVRDWIDARLGSARSSE